MEIYRVQTDINHFQRFFPTDSAIYETDILNMDCQPKLVDWNAPKVYIDNPKKKLGNFFDLCSGAFVVDSGARKILLEFFEIAGELLPIAYEGSTFSLFNVLACVNCLDQGKTKWVLGKTTGARIRILEYHFHPDRMIESTLFKIPETSATQILCVERSKDPEEEFKARVEEHGLKGLLFEKLWSDE